MHLFFFAVSVGSTDWKRTHEGGWVGVVLALMERLSAALMSRRHRRRLLTGSINKRTWRAPLPLSDVRSPRRPPGTIRDQTGGGGLCCKATDWAPERLRRSRLCSRPHALMNRRRGRRSVEGVLKLRGTLRGDPRGHVILPWWIYIMQEAGGGGGHRCKGSINDREVFEGESRTGYY